MVEMAWHEKAAAAFGSRKPRQNIDITHDSRNPNSSKVNIINGNHSVVAEFGIHPKRHAHAGRAFAEVHLLEGGVAQRRLNGLYVHFTHEGKLRLGQFNPKHEFDPTVLAILVRHAMRAHRLFQQHAPR